MPKKIQEPEYGDEVRVRGIRAKGFGQLPRIVFVDPAVSVTAKGIYAYFCSYTGSGKNTAFPTRNRILHDLGLSKDSYYKHFNTLIEKGYGLITVDKAEAPGSQFQKNIYTIESFPSRYASEKEFPQASTAMAAALSEVRKHQDLCAAGYGIAPKAVMIDPELSVQAKGVYAYLSSFAGAGTTASPSIETMTYHLSLTDHTLRRYITELISAGLISRESKTENGRFSGYVYHLLADPARYREEKNQNGNFSAGVFPQGGKIQDMKNQDVKIPDAPIRDAEKSDAAISDTNKANSATNSSNTNVLYHDPSFPALPRRMPKRADGSIDYEKNYAGVLRELSERQTIPESYMHRYPLMATAVRIISEWDDLSRPELYSTPEGEAWRKAFLLFVQVLSEMLTEGHETVVHEQSISPEMVYEKLMENHLVINSLDLLDLSSLRDTAVGRYLEQASRQRISNPTAYMKAIVWTVLCEPA